MKLTKTDQKKVAKEHVKQLLSEASKVFDKDKKLANRYVEMIIAIRNKIKIRLSKEQKARICKECNSFLVPGKNCEVRIKNKSIIYHCKECNAARRLSRGEDSRKK
ncbi:ribonuclease P [Candidatus Woesearchaeota archaeon]|nr:ribonuclease P [Candidatus Woesearchaeota archaeon]